ncbi:sensor histidine kinase [Mycolicibacterium frederiksbergense]|uniref:histidine kinase n=1 Tax=Mycolicibacterium frederiksbergense TaxID=117567 RepID=A0A6H0SB25_9MYCO|nr:HAMP domain-containing sensor histidine kinase [Mycolicibacterium frederiksbergense]QIV83515.1 HAMP domain-containing histidine kinase [Mycolicibacterium frederiksbergense]
MRSRLLAPRTWSLRMRLLVTQVLLLALVCVAIGVATEFALQRFLMRQLDTQVVEAARRSVGIMELPPPPFHLPPPPPGRPAPQIRFRFDPEQGPGPGFLNAPGQAINTVGAVIGPERSVRAHEIDSGVITSEGATADISTAASAQLTQVPPDGNPVTMDLDGLGSYRVISEQPRRGAPTVVVGLPTTVVDETLWWVLLMFCVVSAAALAAATAAGIWIIRRQLEPLSKVSAAARKVADLELDKGEVRLPTPIVPVDPDSAHTEVGQLGSALNRMLDRIAGALSARHASETRVRQFVSDASHELRTPLAAIRGYTELAQRKRDELPEDVAHAMSRVESETQRLTTLVEDMLLLARLDEGRPLERATVDLVQVVADAVSDAHAAGPEHEWMLELPDDPVQVTGDQARLHQVLANLLTNARVHTPAGTTVTTSVTMRNDGSAVLSVTDDGPGIPEALQPEVFERFARGDSSRSRRGGSTGLGLAIVAAVVKAHRGTIDLHSVPGDTRFVITLPADGHS